MYRYPALFDPDRQAGGYVVTFSDFGIGATQGETIEEALDMAQDLLKCLIADRMERKQDLPSPSQPKGKRMRLVSLPALADAKATLYTSMRAAGVRKAELARRLGVAKPQVDRLLDLDNSTRFDRIEAAFRALDKRLRIEVDDAA
jgi:antitoxin HicB